MLLLSAGLITLAIPLRRVAPRPGSRFGLATLFAVLTGFTIAAYIIADGLGVRSAGPTLQHRLSYIAWLCVVEGPWLLVLAAYLRPGTVWAHVKRTWYRGVMGGIKEPPKDVAHGLLAGLVYFAVTSGLIYVVSLFMQQALGADPGDAALGLLPLTIGIIVAAIGATGRWSALWELLQPY